ncbi:desulfoferrodoxin [Patescibacteria group bacterium]|nr:desulfoferrodoxin [Patescibacteria group bacterium]
MAQLNSIYKCNVCGNIVEVLHSGGGTLVCCGEEMHLFDPKTEDRGSEKHVPVIVIDDNLVKVRVGEVPHPMEDEHYIEWIEVFAGNKRYKKFLNPGQEPQAEFCLKADQITARIYCNVHGLWKNK